MTPTSRATEAMSGRSRLHFSQQPQPWPLSSEIVTHSPSGPPHQPGIFRRISNSHLQFPDCRFNPAVAIGWGGADKHPWIVLCGRPSVPSAPGRRICGESYAGLRISGRGREREKVNDDEHKYHFLQLVLWTLPSLHTFNSVRQSVHSAPLLLPSPSIVSLVALFFTVYQASLAL